MNKIRSKEYLNCLVDECMLQEESVITNFKLGFPFRFQSINRNFLKILNEAYGTKTITKKQRKIAKEMAEHFRAVLISFPWGGKLNHKSERKYFFDCMNS